MKLLDLSKSAELPTEALLARLRCRRTALGRSEPATTDPAEVADWVYRRLNRRLRGRLAPFFELLAMRNLTLQLRYVLAGEMPSAPVLSNRLLAQPLRQLLIGGERSEVLVARLEAFLVADYSFAVGLSISYREQGPGGVERQLGGGMLGYALGKSREKLVQRAVCYLIDMRNCLMLSRFWRWQVRQSPLLTAGGTIAPGKLLRIWADHDSERLAVATERLTREPLRRGSTIGMEQAFLRGLARLLRQAGRDPLGLGVIIEYLWRAELAMHDQLLRKALLPDREKLLGEVLLL